MNFVNDNVIDELCRNLCYPQCDRTCSMTSLKRINTIKVCVKCSIYETCTALRRLHTYTFIFCIFVASSVTVKRNYHITCIFRRRKKFQHVVSSCLKVLLKYTWIAILAGRTAHCFFSERYVSKLVFHCILQGI